MKRYVAFLRGINISGKNKIAMADLKNSFEELLFKDVKTCLNSGNIIFSSAETDTEKITSAIKEMINNHYNFEIPVYTILKEDLIDILKNAPQWWDNGDKEIYNNIIFIMPPKSFFEVFVEIGEPKKELEKIENYKNAVFWSFNLKEYQKTNWWHKTASANISKALTIRTANTVKKIAKTE